MEPIKGIEIEFHIKSFSLGVFLSFDDDPSMFGIGLGFVSFIINKPQYFKNGTLEVSLN